MDRKRSENGRPRGGASPDSPLAAQAGVPCRWRDREIIGGVPMRHKALGVTERIPDSRNRNAMASPAGAWCDRTARVDCQRGSSQRIASTANASAPRRESRRSFFREAHIDGALRLSPRDTNAYMWLAVAGFAKLLVSRDEEAIALLRRAIETNRNYSLVL
jgi:hypothetical protein